MLSIMKFCGCFSKNQVRTIKNVTLDENMFKKLHEIVERESMPCFSFNEKTFYGIPTNIYDGDTFSLIFEYNGETIKYRCRCFGYDSPEMKPSLQNPNRDKEKDLAKLAKTRFTELLTKNPNGVIRVKCYKFDKYGRILVDIWNDVDEKSVNDIMIEEGHGKKYDGGKKELWDL